MTEKKRALYYKEYAEKNKEKLREQHMCEICGGKYNTANKANHIKTKKHIIGQELLKYKNMVDDMNKKN